MSIEMILNHRDEHTVSESLINRTEDGIRMSSMIFNTHDSYYCGNLLKTVTIAGVGTEPEYRRAGAVRQMLERIFEMAPERGWAVSFLHPFSFSYYRKFGYEKVADHKVLEFPITKLDQFERCPNLVPVNNDKRAADCVTVYNRFAASRNIMFPRFNPDFYKNAEQNRQRTYLWYDSAGEPAAYIILEVENYFWVNQMKSINLNIYEMAFTSPESLRALFGFMRMYEGENDTVKIHNCAMSPEVDLLLRHYTHTTYTLIPDIAARILNVPAVLKANSYPKEPGSFTVRVEDTLPYTRGTYHVTFGNGHAEVTQLADDAACDLQVPIHTFSQLVYGYEEYTADIVPYMEGTILHNPNSDFFRVFHKKNNGLFEHF